MKVIKTTEIRLELDNGDMFVFDEKEAKELYDKLHEIFGTSTDWPSVKDDWDKIKKRTEPYEPYQYPSPHAPQPPYPQWPHPDIIFTGSTNAS